MSPIPDQQDLIIRDSIIENKERTKNYWEQLMMAAEAEANGKTRFWDTTESSISTPGINRNLKNSYNFLMNSYKGNTKNNCHDCLENCEGELLKNDVRAEISFNSLSMEDRIALELQDQKEREEELRQLRKQLPLANRKEFSPSKDQESGNEELCSIHTNDDSTFSEYGSEEKEHSLDGNNSRVNTPHSEDFIHGRAQSLESVSSGHSSGSGSHLNEKDRDSPRRKILVRPYEDPYQEEEIPIYKRIENETPIEREIRMAKEREEELRKEKGITNGSEKVEPLKIQKAGSKKNAIENDTRDVQHRIATNRIQQEIEEASERENELRTEGKILTTSEERVDAKVTRFTQLAEYAILENRHSKDSKLKPLASAINLPVSQSGNKEKTTTNVGSMNQNHFKSPLSQVTRRYAPNPAQKGVMQRFIATKGRLSLPVIPTNVLDEFHDHSAPISLHNGPLIRKGYIPAGEKIQEELREMEEREEELRLQRAHNQNSPTAFRHRSQPNLLNISDEDEETELHSWRSHKEFSKPASRLNHSASNPNLLDVSLEKVNVRMPNKRFSLLQQWESRIQNAQ